MKKKKSKTAPLSKAGTGPDETVSLRANRAGAFHEMEGIVSAISDIIYVIDLKGRLIKWNKTAETATGYTPEELHEKPVVSFIAPDEQQRVAEAISECVKLGEAEVEAELRRSDGSRVPYHWKGVLVRNEDGAPSGLQAWAETSPNTGKQTACSERR